jgi:hypothetical protein
MVGLESEMEVQEVKAAEMAAEEEAARMEVLSVGAVTHPNPSLLFLVSWEEAGRSTPMAAEAIGIHEAIKTVPQKNDQQGNAGGACIFLAEDLINGGLAEMEIKEEAEDNAAGTEDLSCNRHSCHSPCLVGVSADVPLDDGCSADLFLENVADADDVPEARAPTTGKLVFKGKQASKKLGCNSRRGGDRKAVTTANQPKARDILLLKTKQVPPVIVGLPYNLEFLDIEEIPAIVDGLVDTGAPNIALAPRSCSSKCKVTKIQLIQQLGQATQQLNLETKKKGIALSNVCSITKKLTKSKEVVGQLHDCLKDSRTESQSKDKRQSMEVSTLPLKTKKSSL